MSKTVKDFTDIELKAIVYDHLVSIEKSQIEIKTINQELAQRAKDKVLEPVNA